MLAAAGSRGRGDTWSKWGNPVMFAQGVRYSRGAALAGCDSRAGPRLAGQRMVRRGFRGLEPRVW